MVSDPACRAGAAVPSVRSYLLATDALSDTPLPPTPALPPPWALAIAAVALVLITSAAREKLESWNFPKPNLERAVPVTRLLGRCDGVERERATPRVTTSVRRRACV